MVIEHFMKVFLLLFLALCINTFSAFSQSQTHKKDTTKKVVKNPDVISVKDTITYLSFPNTRIKIIPPLHFISYKKINGFLHTGSSSTIQASEVQGTPYVMYTKGMTPEFFEKQGVKLISEEDVVTKNNKKGKIYIVTFSSNGVDFERMMLLTGDYDHTIWINANYPVVVKFLLFDVIKKSVLSVMF